MIRGIDPERYIRYVPEMELGEDKPTAFWVRSQRGKELNRWLTEYGSAGTPGRKNRIKYEPRKIEATDVEQFCAVVNKVENFEFFEDGEYKYCEFIEDPQMLVEVARQMDPAIRQEVLSVSQDSSRLEETEKKD